MRLGDYRDSLPSARCPHVADSIPSVLRNSTRPLLSARPTAALPRATIGGSSSARHLPGCPSSGIVGSLFEVVTIIARAEYCTVDYDGAKSTTGNDDADGPCTTFVSLTGKNALDRSLYYMYVSITVKSRDRYDAIDKATFCCP